MAETKLCENCGTVFPRRKRIADAAWAVRRYCGRPCSFAAHGHKPGLTKCCDQCGVVFPRALVSVSQGRWAKRRFCSRRCQDAWKRGEESFWTKVVEDPLTGCWNWAGARQGPPGNYGRAKVDGAYVYAHRRAYELIVGVIPRGLTLDHLCRNRLCVKPAHLEPVTLAENVRRAHLGISHPLGDVHPPEEAICLG